MSPFRVEFESGECYFREKLSKIVVRVVNHLDFFGRVCLRKFNQ